MRRASSSGWGTAARGRSSAVSRPTGCSTPSRPSSCCPGNIESWVVVEQANLVEVATTLEDCSMSGTTYDVRRSGERFATRIDWLDSTHSFSFGQHYDSTNTPHGLLLVN